MDPQPTGVGIELKKTIENWKANGNNRRDKSVDSFRDHFSYKTTGVVFSRIEDRALEIGRRK